MKPFRVPALLVAGFLLAGVATGQQTNMATPTSTLTRAPIDAQAVPLIQNALVALGALNGVGAIKDVTLTGTVIRTVGPDTETGSITLKALGTNQSRVDLSVASGTWSEVRSIDAKGLPQGIWVDINRATHKVPAHNTLTDAVWFFPAMSALGQTANPRLAVTYVGLETRGDASVEHLHFDTPNPSLSQTANNPPRFTPIIAELSAREIYLDAASSLPVAIKFNTHPDNNALIDIPVEVDFSDYQKTNGVLVPFHIQESLNGTLFYDITIQSASVNSGLSATEFAVQ